MITAIRFSHVTPNVFLASPPEGEASEVWGKELTFTKAKTYLIEATSGRGKTSFCTFLYGLRSDYQGKIEFLNEASLPLKNSEFVQCDVRQRSLAMMFQEHRLFQELTAVENVMLKNMLTDFFTEKEVRFLLKELGLAERLDTPCARLSLGQQQRVAFVRMLAQPADFFLLDEPISHLDMGNASVMSRMLKDRQLKDGAGVIVTSIGHRLPYEYDTIIRL